MKKTVSIILTLALCLSLALAVPVVSSASISNSSNVYEGTSEGGSYEGRDGDYKIPMLFHEGLSNHGGKIYDYSGTLVKEDQNLSNEFFSDGLMRFAKDKNTDHTTYGYLDKNFNVAIQPTYLEAYPFCGGLARVLVENSIWNGFGYENGYGYIDTSGRMVIPPGYYSAEDFHEGLAYVTWDDKDSVGHKGFIDTNGNLAINLDGRYIFASWFSEGLAAVQIGGHNTIGFIDTSGAQVIASAYDACKPFSGGLAAVQDDNTGKWGFIDKTGALVIPMIYYDVKSFSEGLAAVALEEGYPTMYGFIDTTGKTVLPVKYVGQESEEMYFSEGLCPVNTSANGSYGYIDETGKMVISGKSGANFSEGYALIFGSTGNDTVIKNPLGIPAPAPTPTPPPTPQLTASPTSSTVLINGKSVSFDAYNINDNNYFKLRDIAYALSGSGKQFEVTWDGANNAINLTSGQPYTPVGGEMAGKGAGNKTPVPTTSTIYLDGKQITLTAYNIDDNNYFKLRDIGAAFNFGVDWDGANNTIIIDTSKGYTPGS